MSQRVCCLHGVIGERDKPATVGQDKARWLRPDSGSLGESARSHSVRRTAAARKGTVGRCFDTARLFQSSRVASASGGMSERAPRPRTGPGGPDDSPVAHATTSKQARGEGEQKPGTSHERGENQPLIMDDGRFGREGRVGKRLQPHVCMHGMVVVWSGLERHIPFPPPVGFDPFTTRLCCIGTLAQHVLTSAFQPDLKPSRAAPRPWGKANVDWLPLLRVVLDLTRPGCDKWLCVSRWAKE